MKENIKKERISEIALIVIAILWGTSFAIIKDTLDTVGPFTLMTIRFGLSAILLSIVYMKRLVKINKQDIIAGSIIGIFMFMGFFLMITGIQYTTAAKQSFLIGSYVLIVPFFAWIINKIKPDIYGIIGAVCAVAGLALMTLTGTNGIGKGDALSILASVMFALHMIMIEKFAKNQHPVILTIVQFWVTAILFFVLTAFTEGLAFTGVWASKWALLYLVIPATIIAFAVQNSAQKYLTAGKTSLIMTLESVFGTIFSVLWLDEYMSTEAIVGCIFVFAGIVIEETRLSFIKGHSQRFAESKIEKNYRDFENYKFRIPECTVCYVNSARIQR